MKIIVNADEVDWNDPQETHHGWDGIGEVLAVAAIILTIAICLFI